MKTIIKNFDVSSKEIGIYELDKNGVIIACNEHFLSLIHPKQRPTLSDKKIWEIFEAQHDIALSIQQNNLQVLSSCTSSIFQENYLNPQGQFITYVAHKIPLANHTTSPGVLCFLVPTLTTDSDIKTLALDHVLANLPGHVYWKNTKGIYLGCNDMQAKSLNFHKGSDVIGKTDFDLPWPQSSARAFQKNDEVVMHQGQSLLVEEPAMVNGKEAIVLSYKIPLKNPSGKVVGILGMSIDITERKKVEEKLEKAKEQAETASQVKSEFIANMSHDLRTPITGIMGMHQGVLNMIEDMQRPSSVAPVDQTYLEQAREYMELAQTSTQALLNVFNQIIDAIQMESGKVDPPTVTAFAIRDLLEHSVQLLQSVAHHKQLDLSVHIDPNVPSYLSGIRSYLERSVSNLISNALKFTPQGFVRVTVFLAEDPSQSLSIGETITLIIRVQDSGMGILADKLETIFEQFTRLTPSYKGLYSGSGLGLYMVKKYIEAMQGQIEVDSQVNEGTCFTLTLPLVVSEAPSIASTEASSASSLDPSLMLSQSQKRIRSVSESKDTQAQILIVEDSQMAAMAVEMILTSLGCAVDVAESGKAALNRVQSHPYDLILMDIGLPDTTGVEVTRQIRALSDRHKAQVPIVALTGHAGNDDKRQECLGAGMQAVLSKPTHKADLESVLQQYVFDIQAGNSTQSTEVASELLSILADDLPITREKITQAYQARDIQALRDVLHYLCGGLCYLKVPQLEHTARAFHEAVKAEPLDSKSLEQSYTALQQAIDQFLETMKEPIGN